MRKKSASHNFAIVQFYKHIKRIDVPAFSIACCFRGKWPDYPRERHNGINCCALFIFVHSCQHTKKGRALMRLYIYQMLCQLETDTSETPAAPTNRDAHVSKQGECKINTAHLFASAAALDFCNYVHLFGCRHENRALRSLFSIMRPYHRKPSTIKVRCCTTKRGPS